MSSNEVSTVVGTSSVIEAYRDRQLINLLRDRRVDFVISEDITFIYQVRKRNCFNSIERVRDISSRPVTIALDRKWLSAKEGLDKKINQVIEQLHEENFIANVLIRYLSDIRTSGNCSL